MFNIFKPKHPSMFSVSRWGTQTHCQECNTVGMVIENVFDCIHCNNNKIKIVAARRFFEDDTKREGWEIKYRREPIIRIYDDEERLFSNDFFYTKDE